MGFKKSAHRLILYGMQCNLYWLTGAGSEGFLLICRNSTFHSSRTGIFKKGKEIVRTV